MNQITRNYNQIQKCKLLNSAFDMMKGQTTKNKLDINWINDQRVIGIFGKCLSPFFFIPDELASLVFCFCRSRKYNESLNSVTCSLPSVTAQTVMCFDSRVAQYHLHFLRDTNRQRLTSSITHLYLLTSL